MRGGVSISILGSEVKGFVCFLACKGDVCILLNTFSRACLSLEIVMRKKKSTKLNRSLVDCTPHRTSGGGFFNGITEVDAEYESPNEFNALNTMLLCHDVYKIASQPAREAYQYDGKICHYTPDFLVDTFVSGLRIEVKALSSFVQSKSALEKYTAIAISYRECDIPYAFLTDAQLEQEPRFSNVKLLIRYVTSEVPNEVLVRAVDALAGCASLPISELMSRASLELVDTWTLIARRHLCFDWQTALDANKTIVSLPDQPYGGLKLEDVLRATRYGDFLAKMALGRRPSDKRILADATAWRRHDYPIGSWPVVGSIKFKAPLRHLGAEELIPRNPRYRRNFTLGIRVVSSHDTDRRG